MKIRRSARAAVVLAGALGVMATFVPAASAHSRVDVTFVGQAQLNAGLSFPCSPVTTTTIPDTTVTKGTKTCPPQIGTTTTDKKHPLFRVNGNTRTGTFQSTICVSTGTHAPDKTGKQPEQAGTCSIGAAFTVTGYCGLSQGTGTGSMTVQPNWTVFFNFAWTDPGTQTLIITGNWWKGTSTKPPPGQIEGDLAAVAKVTPDVTRPNNSCFDKTARIFIIEGTATLIHPKCAPPGTLPGCATA